MANRERRRARAAPSARRGPSSGGARSPLAPRSGTAPRARALEPLAEGERPAIVTVGAVISGVVAASVVIAYLAGAEVDGERPPSCSR